MQLQPDATARRRLASLLPPMSPWQQAALWQGLSETPLPDAPPTEAELAGVIEQRLAPLLLQVLAEQGRALTPAATDRLRGSAFSWTVRSRAVVATGRETVELLADQGFAVAVSKGPGIAACYPVAHTRPFSDLDLLVEPARFPTALALLRDRGWAEADRNVQPRAYFDLRCREAVNLERGPGESIDLHHHVPPWLWSTGIQLPALVARAEVTDGLPLLTPADNLLVAALHTVSDKNKPGKTLIIWRDLALLARRGPVADAVARAAETGLSGWLRAVLSALPAPVRPHDLIAALPNAPLPRPRRLALALAPATGERTVGATQLLRLPVVNSAAYFAGMLAPSSQFLARKYPADRHPYLTWLRSPLDS